MARARVQHHLPDWAPGRDIQVPQGPHLDAVGSTHQPARPERIRPAAVPGQRHRDRQDRGGDLLRLAFPEAIRQLALGGAEVLVRVSAYMDPWGTAQPMDWWTTVNRVRALENMAYVVAANQAASVINYPPFSWPGGSMIVDFDGRILSQADPGPHEKIVVGPVDLAALRAERQRRGGHLMQAHLRTEAYGGYQRPIYPAGGADGGPITVELNAESTRIAREALEELSGDDR